MSSQIGLVKWFDAEKGFGVVASPRVGDCFLHVNAFGEHLHTLLTGTAIVFTDYFNPSKSRSEARNAHIISASRKDWHLLMQHLDGPDEVKIETSIPRKQGSHVWRERITELFSLQKAAARQLLRNLSSEEAVELVTGYADEELSDEHFLRYCEVVEAAIKGAFPNEAFPEILNGIWRHFGIRLTDARLFSVWKARRFQYIHRTDAADYEIPEAVLALHADELGAVEMDRIKAYTYGPAFLGRVLKARVDRAPSAPREALEALLRVLQYAPEEEQEVWRRELSIHLTIALEAEFHQAAATLPAIEDHAGLARYRALEQAIPKALDEAAKAKLKGALAGIAIARCSDNYRVDLWLEEYADNAPAQLIEHSFLHEDTSAEKRVRILQHSAKDERLRLLTILGEKRNKESQHSWMEAATLLGLLVSKEERLGYSITLANKFHDDAFWSGKKSASLVQAFNRTINERATPDAKYALFFRGLYSQLPENLLWERLADLNKDGVERVLRSRKADAAFCERLLTERLRSAKSADHRWLYEMALEHLVEPDFASFDTAAHTLLEAEAYFNLWKAGLATHLPEAYLRILLADDDAPYNQIRYWTLVEDAKKDLATYMFRRLVEAPPVTDRIVFYTLYNHIHYLLSLDETYLVQIAALKHDFYGLILWTMNKDERLDFGLLTTKFIYFRPEEQARLLRKLFYFKATCALNIGIEQLADLTRVDLDLYNTSKSFNEAIPLDISTDVVLKSLLSYSRTGKFLLEGEMLKTVLDDLRTNRTHRFQLGHFFEGCLGRSVAKYDWRTRGEIRKVPFGSNQAYFSIHFEYSEELVQAVKQLPGRKWNAAARHWGVPSQYEKDVRAFATKYRFEFDLADNRYEENLHLIHYPREERPNGICYCEGRLAKTEHRRYKRPFWWCANAACFQNCETLHKPEQWEAYTLLDFCEILGLDLDDTNRVGDFIPKGHYYKYIGRINRFNRLLDRLYCRDCNEVLYPVEPSHFAAHAVVRFHCVNSHCNNRGEVYLNHCLNGQCNSIIDSRDSKQCPNGLYVCSECGGCCSHAMLSRKLDSLTLNGGYIHSELIHAVKEKLGHMERAEYFCHKCALPMNEEEGEVFTCEDCRVRYDTRPFRFERPHRHLNRRSV